MRLVQIAGHVRLVLVGLAAVVIAVGAAAHAVGQTSPTGATSPEGLAKVLTSKCNRLTNEECVERHAKMYLSGASVNVGVTTLPETAKAIVRVTAIGTGANTGNFFAFDEGGKVLNDGGKILQNAERKAWVKRHGKTTRRLQKKLQRHRKRKASSTLKVAIWLKIPKPLKVEKPSKINAQNRGAVVSKSRSRFRSEVKNRFPSVALGSLTDWPGAPVVGGRLPPRDIEKLARAAHVAQIYYDDPPKISAEACDATTTWTQTLDAGEMNNGEAGDACLIEVFKLPKSQQENINFLGQYYSGDTNAQGNHPRAVAGALSNTGSGPDGSASAADNFVANWGAESVSVGEAIYHGCTKRDGKGNDYHIWTFTGYGNAARMRYLDYAARERPFPTILSVSGNDTKVDKGQGKGQECYNTDGDDSTPNEGVWNYHYNGLVVNASDDHNTADNDDDHLASCNWHGCWGNPCGSNIGSEFCPEGDRELPHVSSPGHDLRYLGRSWRGTSVATPAAAGAVAQMIENNPKLDVRPEANRAIMLATARQDLRETHECKFVPSDGDHDSRDGAGEVSAWESAHLASESFNFDPGNDADPVINGFDYGIIRFSDECEAAGEVCRRYFVDPSLTNETVALTWNSTATCDDEDDASTCANDHLNANLDLYAWEKASGDYVGGSASFDNGYEYIQLPEFEGIYEITVVMGANPQPEPRTYFGLAVNGHEEVCE